MSVKYKDREAAMTPICDYIYEMGCGRRGNYMVFFPSYKYMKEVVTLFLACYGSEFDIMVQEREMDDLEKGAISRAV